MSKIQETHTQNYPSKILDHNNEIATKKMLLHVEQMIFALEEYSSYKNFLPQNKQRYKKHNKNNCALKEFT